MAENYAAHNTSVFSQLCDRQTLADGLAFYQTHGISRMTRELLPDGTWRIAGKAIDSFQFVSHPWLNLDSTGGELLHFGCDCTRAKRKAEPCPHCVALGLSSGQEFSMPANDEPIAQPAAEEPVVAPIAEPFVPVEEPDIPADLSPCYEPEAQPTPEEETIRSMQILFGHRQEDESPVFWCPNDTEQVFHTNMGIIGTMGTGKTQFTKSVVAQLYHSQQDNYDGYPLGILIFDYKGDYNETKTDFIAATNARVLKPYRLPYNPLALNRTRSFKPLLPMHTANEFKDTIAQIYNLGPKQQQVLLDCIVKAYAKQGIDPADPATWNRTAPTVEQVYQIYTAETIGKPMDSLSAAINKLHQFCLFEAEPRQAISLGRLLNGVVVLDLSGYDSDIQSLLVAITLNQFYAQMHARGSSRTDGRYRQLRNIILVDEADNFMSQDFPSLRKIMKEGREFGVGTILSTQSLTHFIGGEDDYSRYVLTWVVHNVSDLKQRDVEYVFKLPPKSDQITANYATIKSLNKHESVLKLTSDSPVVIRDKAFWQLCQQLGI